MAATTLLNAVAVMYKADVDRIIEGEGSSAGDFARSVQAFTRVEVLTYVCEWCDNDQSVHLPFHFSADVHCCVQIGLLDLVAGSSPEVVHVICIDIFG